MQNSCCCIIVTYNIGNELGKCFFSIKDQVDEVVIVDNGSNKETVEYIDSLKQEFGIKVILNDENMGISYALNQGVKYALDKGYEWILTMDNDSQATEGMIDSMMDVYDNLGVDEKKQIAGIFPQYIEKGFINNIDNIKSDKNSDFEYVISEITSGNLVKSNIFNLVGNFEEKFFIDYVDHEFCYRITNKGFKLIKVKGAILLHSLGNTKIKKVLYKNIRYTNHSSLRRYYITRNRFYTWKNYKNLKGVISFDKRQFVKENLKILFFEDDKIKKFKMIIKAYNDYRNNIFGKLDV